MKALFSLALAVAGLLTGISRGPMLATAAEDPCVSKPLKTVKCADVRIAPFPVEPGWPKLDPLLPGPYFPKPLPYPWPSDRCPTRPKLPKPWPYPPYPEPWPWLKPGVHREWLFGNTQSHKTNPQGGDCTGWPSRG